MTSAPAPVPGPCPPCPWLTANHGRPHPDGWYTRRNRDRLWAGLRRGNRMSCHPTDPENDVTPAARAAGYRPAPAHSEARECIGGLILQQREMQLLNDSQEITTYQRQRPRGLTREGIARLLERLLFGDTSPADAVPRPNLNAPVSHNPLPWTCTHPERSDG